MLYASNLILNFSKTHINHIFHKQWSRRPVLTLRKIWWETALQRDTSDHSRTRKIICKWFRVHFHCFLRKKYSREEAWTAPRKVRIFIKLLGQTMHSCGQGLKANMHSEKVWCARKLQKESGHTKCWTEMADFKVNKTTSLIRFTIVEKTNQKRRRRRSTTRFKSSSIEIKICWRSRTALF